MPEKQYTDLTLKSLHLLSPNLSSDFTEKMKAAVQDVNQRASLGKDRTVTIKLSLRPHPEDADDVAIKCEVASATPTRTHETVRVIRNNKTSQLRFEFHDADM